MWWWWCWCSGGGIGVRSGRRCCRRRIATAICIVMTRSRILLLLQQF